MRRSSQIVCADKPNKAHPHRQCGKGPDYYIPSEDSNMSEDEVYSYTSMIAIFRSSWWPSGVLSETNDFQKALLTNDDVIRITMASHGARQAVDTASKSFVSSPTCTQAMRPVLC